MRLLADENCDRLTVSALRQAGHDVTYIAESDGGLDDVSIYAAACAEQRVLITHDHDFGLMVERLTTRPAAVVLLRLDALTAQSRAATLVQVLESIGEELTGRLVVVEPGRMRHRAFKPVPI